MQEIFKINNRDLIQICIVLISIVILENGLIQYNIEINGL